MATKQQKELSVAEIREKLGRAKSAVLVDACGLTVEQDTRLRRLLRESGVDYKVYKNTMMHIAVGETAFEGLRPFFAGPNALALSFDDETAAARLLSKERKTLHKLDFKGGIIGGTVYDAKGMAKIADIPPREELLSKLLGSFKAPLSAFARVVNAIATKDTAEPTAESSPEPTTETDGTDAA